MFDANVTQEICKSSNTCQDYLLREFSPVTGKIENLKSPEGLYNNKGKMDGSLMKSKHLQTSPLTTSPYDASLVEPRNTIPER